MRNIRLLVYAAGVPEAGSQPPVEALLLVGVAYEVPDVDVADVDGPEPPSVRKTFLKAM